MYKHQINKYCIKRHGREDIAGHQIKVCPEDGVGRGGAISGILLSWA